MKRLLILTCAVCLGFAATATAQDTETETISITKKALPVGAVISEGINGKMDMEQSVAMGGQVIQQTKMKMAMNGKRQWTVLARDDKGISKVKLHVIERKESMEVEGGMEGMDTDEESPLSGKTFVISRGDSGATIEPEGDFEVTGDMEKEIKDQLHEETGALLSPSNGLEKLVEKGKFVVGSEITLGRKDLEKFMGGDNSQFPIESMTFKPTGSRSVLGVDCCVFDVTAKVAPEEGEAGEMQGPPMTAEFTGEAVMRKDGGWLQGMKLSGPMSMEMTQDHEGMQLEIDGSGSMTMEYLGIFTVKQP